MRCRSKRLNGCVPASEAAALLARDARRTCAARKRAVTSARYGRRASSPRAPTGSAPRAGGRELAVLDRREQESSAAPDPTSRDRAACTPPRRPACTGRSSPTCARARSRPFRWPRAPLPGDRSRVDPLHPVSLAPHGRASPDRRWPSAHAVAGVSGRAHAEQGEGERRFPWASVSSSRPRSSCWLPRRRGLLTSMTPQGRPARPPGTCLRTRRGCRSSPARRSHDPASGALFERRALTLPQRSSPSGRDAVPRLLPHGAGTAPASSSTAPQVRAPPGTIVDLLALAREFQQPHRLAPETVAEATTAPFPGLVGALPGFGRQTPNDWGLGSS